jgi:hypothetical protein
MDLKTESHAILERNGYHVRDTGHGALLFEDSVVLGTLTCYDSEEALVSKWAAVEVDFLKRSAHSLRGTEKAWNAYCVFLTSAPRGDCERLIQIEEDFVSTRKIARSAIVTSEALTIALLPLLAVQNWLRVQPINLERLVLTNMSTVMPRQLAEQLLLNPKATVSDLQCLLGTAE